MEGIPKLLDLWILIYSFDFKTQKDAPHAVPDSEGDLGWWFSKQQTYDATEITNEDNGFNKTLEVRYF